VPIVTPPRAMKSDSGLSNTDHWPRPASFTTLGGYSHPLHAPPPAFCMICFLCWPMPRWAISRDFPGWCRSGRQAMSCPARAVALLLTRRCFVDRGCRLSVRPWAPLTVPSNYDTVTLHLFLSVLFFGCKEKIIGELQQAILPKYLFGMSLSRRGCRPREEGHDDAENPNGERRNTSTLPHTGMTGSAYTVISVLRTPIPMSCLVSHSV
jgi:hypothetical protein